MNNLQIIGHLGNDAETKASKSGSTFVTFSVAAKTSWKNAKGVWESHTEWFSCVCNGYNADIASKLLKGDKVFVEGEIRSREYDQRKIYDVRVSKLFQIVKVERSDADEGGA